MTSTDTVHKVHEQAIHKWLQGHGVLAAAAAATTDDSTTHNDRLHSDSDDDDDYDGNSSSPCELCGRTYAHKHFRNVQSSAIAGPNEQD